MYKKGSSLNFASNTKRIEANYLTSVCTEIIRKPWFSDDFRGN